MSRPRDHYEVLGVDRSATADEIRRAHRKLARQFHPDVNKDSGAAERFSEVQVAYDVLSDPESRTQYDRFGHAGPFAAQSGRAGPSGGPSGGGTSWRVEVDPADFSSVFEDIFGHAGGPSGGPSGGASGRRGRGGGRRAAGSPFGGAERAARGTDIEQNLDIDFMTAALGGTRIVHLHATPAQDSRLEVKIPVGIEQGAVLRIAGRGAPGRGGAPPGDVLLTVNIAPHPWFRRQGSDVLIDVPITIVEAALGCTVTVPLLRGSVDLKVPPGTSSGKRLRVKGQGIAARGGGKGDFHVVISVTAPTSLDPADRTTLRELGERLESPRADMPWAASVEDDR